MAEFSGVVFVLLLVGVQGRIDYGMAAGLSWLSSWAAYGNGACSAAGYQ